MSSTAPKFRGKSAVRSAYITVTGSTYGKDTCFTAGALTRHVAMRKYTSESVYQAINKLEADGLIEHVGQLKNQAGRANKRYKVLAERDPEVLAVKPRVRKSRSVKRSAAPVVEPVVNADLSLELRVAQLEARVAELVNALHSV